MIPYLLKKHHNITLKGKSIFYKEINSTPELYFKIHKKLGFSFNLLHLIKIFTMPIKHIQYIEEMNTNIINTKSLIPQIVINAKIFLYVVEYQI